ncbi:hypothetical protein A2715_05395 [Candidatus Woesebacteria bacterium RIFCSPHIGHO2_01_FULL_39_32]|uniref:PD-(D/E)XK endonuclease-like domain-containing protein n=1 Tax=Candidatus Woesebacteria bacterium RIFCSPLOWO2_01_FULL_39_25 TaxID=1802521 RepID=A0A1F8BNP9_9BACT|nr:MAG: hypothetical protein A2715_05395 [Candidatus Woesebacteria bacterium RIFCSPHIGHO2_01_FULL_39_32]OGM38557.1 MAG: hypothetical protein A3F01_04350 [Candidatus Woesebacteria bacterium RIFCSPHIGHO2_12_FULL_38_11]OGM64985.1 MAG: hypothetical protein A2893_05005 [Candidatus Woesebacteria bacterium RIFCSPLOWO2_01_FULL_39_25]
MYKLSPSDFRYLWNDCKHCYFQKVKYGIALPSIGIPGVFSKMNGLLQKSLVGMDLQDLSSELPKGKIQVAEGYLKSAAIPSKNDCYISGRFDFLTKLDDGSFSVIDFKISDPNEDKAQKFSSQLHAYKFALENPQNGIEPKNVSKMGVVIVSPESIEFNNGGVNFTSKPNWFEISEDMDSFYGLIDEVSGLLNGPVPEESDTCAWCKYRLCFPHQNEGAQDDIPF